MRNLRDAVASSVRMARASKRMSQVQVAQQAGTSPSRVSELENGNGDPQLSTVARIADVLDIRISLTVEEVAA